ncbi:Acetylajmalan esterase [Sesamum alatum]|uniref:Acetylajmalan esterase n=1 Tax=Sesamum alatum TaxID=300844 RepID=A0AAE2C918_9LAMI|nr:Acetylajmalan esterase [Sesamum alatum]
MGFLCCYSVFICFFVLLLTGTTSSQQSNCPFNYIYHLGDGDSDNGNAIRTLPAGLALPAARLPYGETFPGRPTGRWSDGRLIIDFAATVLGLTRLKPYLDTNTSPNDGVIFAVAGSPVLDRSFYLNKGVIIPTNVAPLNLQKNWFRRYLNSVCSTPTDCADRLGDSLLLLGDVEGNDIRYPLLQRKSIQDIQTNYVPFVTQTTINTTRELIRAGAKRVIVPGNVPLGCYPSILSEFPSNDPTAYDDLGCLKSVNNLVLFKNTALQTSLASLKLEFPDVTILFADYYTTVETVLSGSFISWLVAEPAGFIIMTEEGFVDPWARQFALIQELLPALDCS